MNLREQNLVDEKFQSNDFVMVDWFLQFVYEPSEEIKKLQRKMGSLFEKQKRKGGVIDVEQERNKFLIDITTVRLIAFQIMNVSSTKHVKNNWHGARGRTQCQSQDLIIYSPFQLLYSSLYISYEDLGLYQNNTLWLITFSILITCLLNSIGIIRRSYMLITSRS